MVLDTGTNLSIFPATIRQSRTFHHKGEREASDIFQKYVILW